MIDEKDSSPCRQDLRDRFAEFSRQDQVRGLGVPRNAVGAEVVRGMAHLGDRLQEAREQGWLGEVAAIEATLAAAAQKLQAMRDLTTRPASTSIHIGMPDVRPSAGRRSPGS